MKRLGRLGVILGVAAVVLWLGAGSAQAVFVNGSVSISDGGLTVSLLNGTTSIVSQLNSLTQGPPVATSSTGNLSGAGAPTSAQTLNLPAPPGTGQYTVTVAGDV